MSSVFRESKLEAQKEQRCPADYCYNNDEQHTADDTCRGHKCKFSAWHGHVHCWVVTLDISNSIHSDTVQL